MADTLLQAPWRVKRHQQHPGCDADLVGAGGNRRGGGQDRGVPSNGHPYRNRGDSG